MTRPSKKLIKRIGEQQAEYVADSWPKLTASQARSLTVRLNAGIRSYHKDVERVLGLHEAIFIAQLRYFLQKKIDKKQIAVITDDQGRKWQGVYNSYEQWQEWLPEMSIRKLRRLVRRLEQLEIIWSKRGPWQKWYGLNAPALLYYLDHPEAVKHAELNDQEIGQIIP